MGGGAWPFLVGGVICLVNSVNERDLSLLNNSRLHLQALSFLEGLWIRLQTREVWGNNRSVMPLDVLGRTRATLTRATSISAGPRGSLANLWNRRRARDRPLQFLVVQRGMPCKCESSTRVEYVPALCTHRPSLLPIE